MSQEEKAARDTHTCFVTAKPTCKRSKKKFPKFLSRKSVLTMAPFYDSAKATCIQWGPYFEFWTCIFFWASDRAEDPPSWRQAVAPSHKVTRVNDHTLTAILNPYNDSAFSLLGFSINYMSQSTLHYKRVFVLSGFAQMWADINVLSTFWGG